MIHRLFLLVFLLVSSVPASCLSAGAITSDQTPEPLKSWVDWVLYGKEESRCPRLSTGAESTLCRWPSRLTLDLTETGGRFRQEWQLFAPGWVPLPGGSQTWPQGLMVKNKPHPLLPKDGQPGVWLPTGNHQLEGTFLWQTVPESLSIPPATALVELTLMGQSVPFPSRDQQGLLWLRTKPPQEKNRPEDEDHLELTVHRLIADGVPVTVTTRIEVVVSGKTREMILDQPLVMGTIPMTITSELPARVEDDGKVRLQAKPGRWKIRLTHRLTGRGEKIALPASLPGSNWPTEETWAFQANPAIRLVEPSGPPAIDPQQTNLPKDWKKFQTFIVKAGNTLILSEKHRGASDQEDRRFSLARSWWLDFDGQGLTVQDRIQGTQQRPHRLEMAPPYQLGRVVVAGADQLITRLPDNPLVGVELRDESLDIVAESRIPAVTGNLPVVGWTENFQSFSGVLHLPPGWQVFSVDGVDSASPTWVGRWTLLDLFLLLVTAMAVTKLWGRVWGTFTVITIALSYHDQNSLVWILLHILAAVALLRVVPAGRFRRFLEFYRGGALATLALVFLPFAVEQVRQGIYPQLDHPVSMGTPLAVMQKAEPESADQGGTAVAENTRTDTTHKAARYSVYPSAPKPAESKKKRTLERMDPNARIQTGPGLPDWDWRRVSLNWHGPITHTQEISFHFLPPSVNRFLAFARVILFALLLWRVTLSGSGPISWPLLTKRNVAATLAAILLFFGSTLPAKASDWPSPELLQDLQNRLLAPPDCLPNCADIPRMKMELATDFLRILLEAHAQETAIIPLPGDTSNWMPKTILLDTLPATALARLPGGHLGIMVEKGIHHLVLEGPLPPRKEKIQISLPMPPHRADLQTHDWKVEGILPDGRVQTNLLLTREVPKETSKSNKEETLQGGPLPAFLQVSRTLHLHLDWSVETTVTRLTPSDSAVVLRLPLLTGESVTTPGLRVEGGDLLLNLPAHATSLSWSSSLVIANTLTLTASEQTAWSEVWSVQANPIWHVESTGIPPVQRVPGQGVEQTWNPWPGEQLTLRIARPQGITGPTLTIQKAALSMTPGQRTVDLLLDLTLLSSQGGQHTITLPGNSRVNSLAIDNRLQPVSQQGEKIILPLTPGISTYRLAWQEERGLRIFFPSSVVDLGLPSVNDRITIKLPSDRWLLWAGGPQLGPAILVWGVLAVLLLASFGLSRIPGLPLTSLQWFLLGMGLVTVFDFSALAVVAWFFLMYKRSLTSPEQKNRWFNLMQLLLGFWTLMAFFGLLESIHTGLLGLPEMQVVGNNSTLFQLNWYQDRSGSVLPSAWVVSVPLVAYRFIMLAWALWLATAVMAWAKWGWDCFSKGGIWRGSLLCKLEKK